MAPTTPEKMEREVLIQRRWKETGVKLWDPNVHGEGLAPLNIEGQIDTAPAKQGQPPRKPDILEFKLVRSYMTSKPVDRIICEGVLVAMAGVL
jgi:hypothetical protein